MNIYLAIKYYADHANRTQIETIVNSLTAKGHVVRCVTRDVEEWGTVQFTPELLMRHSFRLIDQADLLLIEFSQKGVGLGIEAGYAHARGIPIVVIARNGSDLSTTIQGIAAQVYFYDQVSDLAALSLPQHTAQSPTATWRYAVRSVDRLLDCAEKAPPAALNWRPMAQASTIYALATHITGNIRETVWGIICGQPVDRDRYAEFQAEGIDVAILCQQWRELCAAIDERLAMMSAADLAKPRMHPRRGSMSAEAIFVVVARHAAEHLAQAEMTADLFSIYNKTDR